VCKHQFATPTPLAQPHSRANAHAHEGEGGGQQAEEGWGDALFTCCFGLFSFVCDYFITVKKKEERKRSLKLSVQSRPGTWKCCEMVRATSKHTKT
jgi:hypothetical protein